MNKALTIEGNHPLEGRVNTHGAKNSALPLLAATLLTDEPVVLNNIPDLQDVATMLDMITQLGKEVTPLSPASYRISGTVNSTTAPVELVTKMRASFLVLSPLVGRYGEAQVALPGGCTIGSRPVNLHLEGLSSLGATITQEDGRIRAHAEKLLGSDIFLDYPSVGTTEQLIMAAITANGTTRIYNPAREPEIKDLIHLLCKLGADISVEENAIFIQGTETLGGAEHQVISDRIEAGTYLLAGAITGGQVTVTDTDPQYLKAITLKLREAGLEVKEKEREVTVVGDNRPSGIEVTTLPYPGFPTDLQAPITAMLCIADGESVIEETVFDSRVDHVPELNKLGAKITLAKPDTIFITGTNTLQGTSVDAPDIRAGAALILAGLASKGKTTISGMEHVDRGYTELVTNLGNLGAQIRRTDISDE